MDYKTVPSGTGGDRPKFFSSVVGLLKIPTLRWFFLGYGLMMITQQAMLAWSPALIMREFNVKEDVAGSVAGSVVVMAVVGALLGGWLTDFWQKRNGKSRMLLPGWTSLVSGLLLIAAVLLLGTSWPMAAAMAGLSYLVYYLGMPALGAVSQEVVHPAFKGLSWGLTVFFMYMLGGAWSPWLTGGISDSLGGGARGLEIAIMIACAGGLAGAFCFFMGSRSFVADADRVKGARIEAER